MDHHDEIMTGANPHGDARLLADLGAEHWTDRLVALDACQEAVEWAKAYPTLDAAWAACERADWMIWLVGMTTPDRRAMVGCAAEIARAVLHVFEAACPGDARVHDCLDLCDRYARGEDVSEAQMREAITRAADAADAAARAAARAAALAASLAADAAALAAAYAADAAALAASASASALAAADTPSFHRESADIVRKWFPAPPVIGGAA